MVEIDGVEFDKGLIEAMGAAYNRAVLHKELRDSEVHGADAREAEESLVEHLGPLGSTPEKLVTVAGILLVCADELD